MKREKELQAFERLLDIMDDLREKWEEEIDELEYRIQKNQLALGYLEDLKKGDGEEA